MARTKLDLPAPPPEERRAFRPRRILSLWGGGYRGLFTARILERLEGDGPPLRDRFDLIAGTSIGGILAIGLSLATPASRLRAAIQENGPRIFRRRRIFGGGVLGARYAAGPLRATLRDILQDEASLAMSNAPSPIIVTALNHTNAGPEIIMSDLAAPDGRGSSFSLLDAGLATSAAPTYFPPHRIGGDYFIDGGLVANAPDLLAATIAMRRYACDFNQLHICSIGTAGSPITGPRPVNPTGPGWVLRHKLIERTIDGQATAAALLSSGLLKDRVLRLDRTSTPPIAMDDPGPATTERLLTLADRTFDAALAEQSLKLRGFQRHRRAA